MRISRKRWLALAGAALLAATTVFAASTAYADPGGTITGQVLDNGAPVPNVSVQAMANDGSVWIPPTTTDASGAFTVANVPAGAYRVSYQLPGNAMFFANGAIRFEDSAVITVADGATVTLNESVPAHGSIGGRLTRSDGSGVSAMVQAWGPPGSFWANTEPDGGYTFPYVWVGSYRVQFNPNGAPQQYAFQQTDVASAQVFTVTAGATTTVDDTLVPVGTIAGRITNQGAPASFAHVQILDSTSPFDHQVGSAFTSFDGTYQVSVLPGTYKVKVGFPNGISQYAHQKASLAEADTFTVAVGETTIVDEEAVVPSTIRGTLTNADGTPATGAFVSLQSSGNFFNAFVGPTGAWSASVLPGTYTVAFRTQLGVQFAFGKTSAETADPITVAPGATVDVNDALLPPGSVTVTASDRKTGAALTSFCVNHNFGGNCTTTGSITEPLLAGEITLTVYTEDQSYTSQLVTATVASGQDTPVAVQLAKAATVSTVIKDAETGAPVVGACLQLVLPLDPTTLRGFAGECSGPDGAITMRGVIPGVYNAFVNVQDGEHGMQWVGWFRGTGAQAKGRLIVVGDGAAVTLPAIKLDKASTVTGTISDQATGAPLEQAFIGVASFNSGLGETGPGTFTDAAGHYTLGNLGPYEWTFFLRHFGHASVFSGGAGDRFLATGVKLTAGQSTTYDQSMRAGTLLTGVVTNADGSPLTNFVRVTLVSALSGDELDISDVTGSQPYELRVASPLLVKLKIGSEYVGGPDFLHARVFLVGTASPQTQNISLN